jgi:polysaccharide deacetylase family protein (PEP-CTERM system associated)
MNRASTPFADARGGAPLNLLTFDIEGFVEASQEIMPIPRKYCSEADERREIEVNTLAIVDVLAELKQRATFFILGRIARDMKSLVRRISDAGHEIGCHSFEHRRLYNFAPEAVRLFLREAKSCLEAASGAAVRGFRAPDFSITKKNIWAFDVLLEAGFSYDSSVYPTSLHDVYGIRDFPDRPFRLPNGLIEFPMSAVSIGKQRIPFGGGGYLRLYPLRVTKFLYQMSNARGVPGMLYLHPCEVGGLVPRIDEFSTLRKFRTYVGIKDARRKLVALIKELPFVTISDYLARYPVS